MLSAQSRGKEIFRIQADFLPGEWTDEANNVSFNARIAFSGIYGCAEYDGHKFYNVDIENIHSLRKSDGRFLSLAGVFKKYRIDTLKIISVAYEKISYSDVRILSEDTDTMWKEITPLIRLGYSFRSRTVRSDGEFVKKPLALHTKSRKRVKALNPNYYKIGQLRKTRQTTRVSTPGVPDYERITSIG